MAALWVCEKYAVASELARVVFGGVASHTPPVIVTRQTARLVYTNGHALEPAAPEDYDPAYKSWDHADIGALVRQGFRLVPAPGKSAALSVIVKELLAASEIVVATDAGREGEMIAWELIEHAGAQAPVRRFWTSALTDTALKRAAAELLPAERKLPLYHAGRARARADWIEGLSYTRYFSRHHTTQNSKPLSVGRVQSAVTALVEDRCREIADFVPRTYFEVDVTIETPHGPLKLSHRPAADQRIEQRAEAEAIATRIMGQTGALSIETQPKASKPDDFLSTSGAQKGAFGLWHWTPDRTLALLQKLYEAKLVTYPRTECTFLSADHAHHMPGLLARLAVLPEIAAVAHAHPDWIREPVIRTASYDDAKLTDHHAIIPTEHVPDLAQLDPDEAKLYQLIARQTAANLLPDFRYDSTTVTARLDGRQFVARGRAIREPGWRALVSDGGGERDMTRARKRKAGASNPDDEEEGTPLPPVENGERATVRAAAAAENQTRPPAYFTQASLLDAMVNIDLYLDAPRAKRVLGGPSAGQKRGIGTGATRAHVIKTIFERGYVEEQGTALHATARGSAFIALARRLVPWMADPLHSVEQEAALQDIEAGTGDDGAYVSDVLEKTHQALAQLQAACDTTRIADGAQAARRERPSPARTGRRGKRDLRQVQRDRSLGSKVYFSVRDEKRDEALAAGLRQEVETGRWYAWPELAARLAAARKAPGDATGSGTAAPAAQTGRTYYRVPFARKEEAKAVGMKFDGTRKQWFAPSIEIAATASALFARSE